MPISNSVHPRIRDAQETDVPILIEFLRELVALDDRAARATATETLLLRHMFGNHPYAAALIADDESGTPLGMAIYYFTFSTWLGKPSLYIEDLYVRESSRRIGVGRRFIRELARIARDRGCGRIQWALPKTNEKAARFYEALGSYPVKGWQLMRIGEEKMLELAK